MRIICPHKIGYNSKVRRVGGLRGFSSQAFCFKELLFLNSPSPTYSKMKHKLPSRYFLRVECPVVVVMGVGGG